MAVGIGLSFAIPLITQAAIDGPLNPIFAEPDLSAPWNSFPAAPIWWEAELALDQRTWIQEVGVDLGFETSADLLWFSGALILALAALSGFCLYLRARWAATASEGIVRGIRDGLYEHLGRLPCRYYDKADTGDLVQRCTSDVETVRAFLSTQIVEIARAVLLVSIVTPLLFSLNRDLALLSLALIPIIVTFALIFFTKIKAHFKRMDEAEGRMTTVLQENLTAIRVVRAFARQDFEREKFGDRNAEFRDHHNRFIQLLGLYWSSSDMLCLGQIGIVLIGGGALAMGGAITVGTLAAFLEFQFLIIWPVRQLGRVLSEAGKAVVSSRRLREVLDAPVETHLDPSPTEKNLPLSGALSVEHLTFHFSEKTPALQDVSFELGAGETLALIGPPGSGKTTLIQLLLRLYDYEVGAIRYDGRELNELPRRFVRSHFGVVLQEPFLFSKSVRANLELGSADANEEMLFESTSAAAVHDAILEFKEGYDTLVGERGVTLSGGQRQRIALARALLKDPPILVLDDALSAVDTETESHILQALETRRGERTTIIIAHRLSSVLHADKILVFETGQIVQSGNHEELIGQEGPYRRLWEIQGALEEEIREDLKAATTAEERA